MHKLRHGYKLLKYFLKYQSVIVNAKHRIDYTFSNIFSLLGLVFRKTLSFE